MTKKDKRLLTEKQSDALYDKVDRFLYEDAAFAHTYPADSKEARAIAKRGLALADSLRKAFGVV